jgi:hypothetical protein
MRYNGHKNYETLQCHSELLKDFVLSQSDLQSGVSILGEKLRSFVINNLPMYDQSNEDDPISNKIITNWIDKVDFDGLAKLYMMMYR